MEGTSVEADLAVRVAAAVTAHPGVAGLHRGRYGDLITYLPGGRLSGVRVGAPGAPVEVGVVVRLGAPIPDVVQALRAALAPLVGGAPVDIAVMDVVVEPLIDPAPAVVSGVVPGGAVRGGVPA